MNDYLISIRPQWMAKILNGEKTVEICNTIPKELKDGHPCTFWGYCTMGKPYLYRPYGRPTLLDKKVVSEDYFPPLLNGLVICKFMVEKVRRVVGYDYETDEYSKPFFEIHITALEIIEPLELGAFGLTKAPQSWCRVIPPEIKR